MPAETSGFAYFELEGLVPLTDELPGRKRRAGAPGRSRQSRALADLVAYGATDGKTMRSLGVE